MRRKKWSFSKFEIIRRFKQCNFLTGENRQSFDVMNGHHFENSRPNQIGLRKLNHRFPLNPNSSELGSTKSNCHGLTLSLVYRWGYKQVNNFSKGRALTVTLTVPLTATSNFSKVERQSSFQTGLRNAQKRQKIT